MILADASVWIDAFRGRATAEVDLLERLLRVRRVAVADVTLTEVLQGFDTEGRFEEAAARLTKLPVVRIADPDIAVEAARNYRRLRALGVTVRGTIDTLIATRCIIDGHALLFSDRDFVPFVRHLGLRSAMDD